ncbi:MAG: stalk domain-containing protein, partial [Cellulosilyticaceae bacterium]
MKTKFTNKAKTLMVVGVIGVLGFSLTAAPLIQEVKAQLKYNLAYTLNGQNVLEGTGGLIYKDQVYVPLRDVATTLGATVSYKDGQVTMIQGEAAPTEANTKSVPEAPVAQDTMTIEKAVVKEVNLENSQVIILPNGLEDKVEN